MRHTLVAVMLCIGFCGPLGHAAAQERMTPELTELLLPLIFAEDPQLVAIAQCESMFRQYGDAGGALRGGWQGKMVGLFQLHEDYHRAPALARGWDIDTFVGNVLYARELYRAQGTTPWRSSQHCWGPALNHLAYERS